ncbi:hypothetical protein SBADM41S_10700 [Streptomyces badius]
MSEVQLRRAEQAVSANHQNLTNLSGTRLGLAASSAGWPARGRPDRLVPAVRPAARARRRCSPRS